MQHVGKYELEKVLGQGASGTVYLARDSFSGDNVALKVLNPEVLKNPDSMRRINAQFMSEASLAGKLSHPHIASILEASIDGEEAYIALEYVAGGI